MYTYENLIDTLVQDGYLRTPEIIDAFRNTPRIEFLPKSLAPYQASNAPLPIGGGQTISQPLTVAFMLEHLQPHPGDRVLEVGYGSGWQTAILAKLVYVEEKKNSKSAKSGKIFSYEILKYIAEFGRDNLKKHLKGTTTKCVQLSNLDFQNEFLQDAPYDKIISAAAFREDQDKLAESLSIGGIQVYPTAKQDIRKITRISKTEFKKEIFPGFVFVPVTHGE